MTQDLRERMHSKRNKKLTEWEKITVSFSSNKGLIFRIYRQFKKLNLLRINIPIKKLAHD
jgi:hypothetical protein